jgi:hypothetical protein
LIAGIKADGVLFSGDIAQGQKADSTQILYLLGAYEKYAGGREVFSAQSRDEKKLHP